MSRLKKADHDIANRDQAVIYIDGNFYEDVTHAACLKKFIEETGYKDSIKSVQYRPDFEKFQAISEDVGTVVLGHIASKENAIFLIYGIIDGETCEFADIPDDVKNEFKKHYNLEVADEMKHNLQLGDENDPYKDDYEKNTDKAIERMRSLRNENYNKMVEKLTNDGFKKEKIDDTTVYTDGFSFIEIYDEENDGFDIEDGPENVTVYITVPGNCDAETYCNIDDFETVFSALDFSCVNYLKEIGAKSEHDDVEISYTFKNMAGDEITVKTGSDCNIELEDINNCDGDFLNKVCEHFNDETNLTLDDLKYLYSEFSSNQIEASNKKRRLIASKNKKFAQLMALVRCANGQGNYVDNLVRALDDLTDNNVKKPLEQMLDEIKQTDPDCLYTGTSYRKLAFNRKKFVTELQQRCDSNEEFPKSDIEEYIRSIVTTGTYQSTTSDLSACEKFDDFCTRDITVILTFQVNDGIDVMKIGDKYLQKLKNGECGLESDIAHELIAILDSMTQWYQQEKEVFAILPDNFKIFEINEEYYSDIEDPVPLKFICPVMWD